MSFSLLHKTIGIKRYKTVTLAVVLHNRETRSLALRKEHRLKVFENRVLRRIFGCKTEEVVGGWRKFWSVTL
jgi:hypothetical protein